MLTSLLLAVGSVQVESQHLEVTLDPTTHTVTAVSSLKLSGSGRLRFELAEAARELVVDGVANVSREGDALEMDVPDGTTSVRMSYSGVFEDDVAAGERPGQIHNFSVDAHVGTDGIFLSDGSAWHPRPLDETGRPMLHRTSVTIQPLEGWVMTASGDPVGEGSPSKPVWSWATPRAVDGVAVVGNRHVVHATSHPTPYGPVEVVMHVPPEHKQLAPLFVNAACAYLDLYTPRLGAYPYRRFTIVENFFSSGFAFPGFTVLGPRVVGMAPRSLAPGYLDHELVHSWWGNGVYVDAEHGNWCEALTSYCANYWRRVADDGEAAGREYRRGVLMKLATDPSGLDDGPLAAFGSADPAGGGPDRFVGYDKGAFVFMMLEDVLREASAADAEPMWTSLRRFKDRNLGTRASWADLQAAFEAQAADRPAGWLDGFFRKWLHEHTVPQTNAGLDASRSEIPEMFARQYDADQPIHIEYDGPERTWCEIDPEFRLYRVLPPDQIVPTVAGTLGTGGVVVVADASRPEAASFLRQVESDEKGQNLLLIGEQAIRDHAELIAATSDPITITDASFAFGGAVYDDPFEAVLHTMQHPERPGRFITVFHANGNVGWSRLRLIRFYTRDTTILWSEDQVIDRRVFEPDRTIELR